MKKNINLVFKFFLIGLYSLQLFVLLCLLLAFNFQLSTRVAHAATISKAPNNLGLVDYWPLNEGIGLGAGDFAGSNNNGTLSGSTLPAWINGKRGGALSFNGSTARVNLGTVNITASTTVSAWIKTSSAGQVPVFSNRGNGLYFGLTGGRFFIYYNTGTPGAGHTSAASVNSNTWRHVVWTSDGSTSRLYIDGNLDSSQAQARTAQSGTAYIGYDSSNNEYFPGSVDEVRIYNTTLSASQISDLYKAGSTVLNSSRNKKLTNGLLAMWSFNAEELTASVAYDATGNSKHATLLGSPKKTIGKVAQGLSFLDSSQYASSSVYSELGTSNQPYSFAAWVKPATGETDGNVIHMSSNGSGVGWCLPPISLVSGKATANSWNGNTVTATGVSTISPNQWYHLATTWDTSGLKIYVNGVLENTASQATYSASGTGNYLWLSFTPGSCAANAGDFDGSYDEVRVYGRSLSASEIYSLYSQNETKINFPQNSKSASGLVGMWSFNGPDYDSSSTTAEVLDVSGNGNRGNNFSATLTQGKVGQALNFNGTNSRVIIPDSNSLDATNVTVSAWFRADSWADGDRNGVFIKGEAYYLTVDPNGKIHVYAYGKTSAGYHASNATLNINEWYHVALTIDDNGFKTYINGVLDNTVSTGGSVSVSGADAAIGSEHNGTGRFFNGKIDEVRVYNRALSAAEIKQLYNMGR